MAYSPKVGVAHKISRALYNARGILSPPPTVNPGSAPGGGIIMGVIHDSTPVTIISVIMYKMVSIIINYTECWSFFARNADTRKV